jgi:hypothetical protein
VHEAEGRGRYQSKLGRHRSIGSCGGTCL